MHLKQLPFDGARNDSDRWTVCAISKEDGECQLEQFLLDHSSGPLASHIGEMIALLEQLVIDPKGPQRWEGTSRCHESVAGERIFEFRVGPIRVHWFYGQPRQVAILACGVIKASRTTPGPLAKRLRKQKSQYEADFKSGAIFFIAG